MRTTLDLPEDLLNEAMKAAHIKTKTKVIITALEELIRKSKISRCLYHYVLSIAPITQSRSSF